MFVASCLLLFLKLLNLLNAEAYTCEVCNKKKAMKELQQQLSKTQLSNKVSSSFVFELISI